MRSGHTLLDLAAVLAVAAVATALALPPARAWADVAATVSARESVAGLVAEARAAALGRGGVRVHVQGPPWRAWWEVDGAVARAVDLEADLGVSVVLTRERSHATLEYDALGLGRVASETLRFTRGDAQSALVISAYGRVRRP